MCCTVYTLCCSREEKNSLHESAFLEFLLQYIQTVSTTHTHAYTHIYKLYTTIDSEAAREKKMDTYSQNIASCVEILLLYRSATVQYTAVTIVQCREECSFVDIPVCVQDHTIPTVSLIYIRWATRKAS